MVPGNSVLCRAMVVPSTTSACEAPVALTVMVRLRNGRLMSSPVSSSILVSSSPQMELGSTLTSLNRSMAGNSSLESVTVRFMSTGVAEKPGLSQSAASLDC